MTLRPHICHLFSTFVEGGPQLRIAAIMNALRSSVSHTVIALDGNTAAACRVDSSVEVRYLPAPPKRNAYLYPLELARLLKEVRPDLLVTYNWGAIDGVIGAQLAPVCPVVHHEHGFGPDEAASLKLRRVWTRRLVLRRTYCTIVPSAVLREIALTRYKIPPQKVVWIRNGVDLERFRPAGDARERRRLGISDRTLLLGFIGALRGEKNLPMLLRAFAAARLGDARLVLVGDGPEAAELRGLAQALGIGDAVIFAGATRDTASWLRSFDCFVMSSMTEQMPMALLEAMACGLPAICTDVGDCAEILGSRELPVIVPSGDVAAYAHALQVLAGSAGLRARLGAGNRARCESSYSHQRMIREYEELYYRAASPANG